MYNNIKTKRILAKNVLVSNDTWVTGRNNNDLLVGPSGSGKTRGYVVPNLLHAQDSLIVADTKGNLYRLYGEHLRKKGYTVMYLDFTEVAYTPWGYNPLAYIRKCRDMELHRNGDYYSEQDVKKVAQAICPRTNSKEPFWDEAAQMYLEAIILFVLNLLPQEQHNLYEVYTFLSKMGTPALENMIEEECTAHPDSAFARKIGMIRQNAVAEKMDASIKGVLAQHLNVVTYSGVKRMFCMKQQGDMDAFPRDFLEELLHYSAIIFTNEVEREAIEQIFGFDMGVLLEEGQCRLLITTLGKDGSKCYYREGGKIRETFVPVCTCGGRPVVDTTGSGDAYVAGFLYGYLRDMTPRECAMLGTVLSSCVIEEEGCCTGAPTEEKLLERCRRFAEELKGEM